MSSDDIIGLWQELAGRFLDPDQGLDYLERSRVVDNFIADVEALSEWSLGYASNTSSNIGVSFVNQSGDERLEVLWLKRLNGSVTISGGIRCDTEPVPPLEWGSSVTITTRQY